MRKNPIERAAKFHLGKGDKCGRGPLIKSSCFTVIFFRALSLTLPFHYLCSNPPPPKKKRREKNCAIVFSCYIVSHYIAIFVRRETERKSARNLAGFFFLSDDPPCSCWSEKKSAWMSNCPQNTMKDWFAALFRALTLLGGELNRKPVSRGWNKDVLSAGKEGKLPI